MSVKLKKEHIKISGVLHSGYCHTTAENDIIVPDINPDVLKVLRVSNDVVITQQNIQADKVYIQGVIRINILYVPDGDVIGNVKSISTTHDFSHLADVRGAKPGMDLYAEAECEMPEYTLINSRKLNVRSKIGMEIKVTQPSEIDIATDIDGEEAIQTKTSRIKICSSCADAIRDIIIRDRLEVPSGKPDLGELLKFSATPHSTELRIIDGKAVVKGELKICVLYGGNDEDCSIQFMEHTLPFTEILEIDGLAEGMEGEIDYFVKDLYCEILRDSDGDKRILGVELTLCAHVKATESIELDTIIDAYGLENEIIINRSTYNLEQVIENTFAQCPLKERISVPDYLPELQQICDCSAVPAIENVTVDDGKVTVNGTVCCNVLYISPTEDLPVAHFSHIMPFTHSFDVPGIHKNSVCDAKCGIEHLSYNMSGSRELELRIVVSIGLKAVNPDCTEMVDSIEWDTDAVPRKIPSMVIYFVQENDTLWDIAKRYKTTPDKIIANNGDNEKDVMKVGKQLYIV